MDGSGAPELVAKVPMQPRPAAPAPATGPMVDLIKRLPAYARIVAAMSRDDRVPVAAKGILVVAGAYLVSPFDLVPGIIPIAGQLDDLYVVLTGLQQASRICPPNVATEHFERVGLTPDRVDEDLAAIRAFVRTGFAWSLQQGSRLVTSTSRQVTSLVKRYRNRGADKHAQDTWVQRSSTSQSGTTAGVDSKE